MKLHFPLLILTFAYGTLLPGCKNYSVSLNDRTVYTPAPLFTNYQITDEKLHACVEQTIYDLKITKADELIRLNCSNAGISSLAGLDKFFALTELNLANNQITDIGTLGKLGRLEVVMINNNAITNPAPLLNLLHIQMLDITQNPGMTCKDLHQLAENLQHQKPDLKFPAQCSKS